MPSEEKLRTTHFERKACVYVRQSSMAQVLDHRESGKRQYDLRQRAIELGWDPIRIEVIDEDQARSSRTTDGRSGFVRLAEEIAHGLVGGVLMLEVARAARSSADWHRLLELCALADVTIADEEAVYHPADYNDRLLLGMKGQFAEAELQWMRLRLTGARLSKARRGELVQTPPVGYVWNDDRKLVLDPNEDIQRAVKLVFERFRIDSNAYAVMRYFSVHGLRFPAWHRHRDAVPELMWNHLSHSRVCAVLKNPTYAGAYVYGRRRQGVGLVDGEIRRRTYRRLPLSEWRVRIPDAHVGYITWKEHLEVTEKLRQNRPSPCLDHHGAPRVGAALLQGLVLCGRCGRRMSVRYANRRHLWYECRSGGLVTGDGTICFGIPGHAIDTAVEELFLRTMCPPEIELGLAVAREVERQATQVDQQWDMRLERARYDARKSELRFKAVDPDNRLVARNLERDWNERLRDLEALEQERDEVKTRERLQVTDEDRRRIVALARDLESVWRKSTTTEADRKNLLRMLVRQISLSPVDVPTRSTRVRIMWHTDTVTELLIARPSKGQVQRFLTPVAVVDRVRDLVQEELCDRSIAETLNREGLRSGHGAPLTAHVIEAIRRKHGMPSAAKSPSSVPLPPRRQDGKYSVKGVASELGVSINVVRHWERRGLLVGERGLYGSWWFTLDKDTRERLEAAKARGTAGRPDAAPIPSMIGRRS